MDSWTTSAVLSRSGGRGDQGSVYVHVEPGDDAVAVLTLANGKVNADLSVGALAEIAFDDNRNALSNNATFGARTGNDLQTRIADIVFTHKAFGKVSMGSGNAAANGVMNIETQKRFKWIGTRQLRPDAERTGTTSRRLHLGEHRRALELCGEALTLFEEAFSEFEDRSPSTLASRLRFASTVVSFSPVGVASARASSA